MKTFLWLLLLGVIIYVGYVRSRDYGFPWDEQVEIVHYEHNRRHIQGDQRIYVHGEVRNQTRKPVQAEIECKTLPEGLTLTPKSWTTVTMQAREVVPFHLQIESRMNATGAACKVRSWSVGGGLEERVWGSAKRLTTWVRSFL